MRNQVWLDNLFADIWNTYFSNVKPYNEIMIKFGRRARTRLGSISLDPKQPHITVVRINGLFKEEFIPLDIVKATIVHELCHYVHGFNSGREPQYRYPHAGGVMRKEFAERGLEDLYHYQKEWLKRFWPGLVKQNFKPVKHRGYRYYLFKHG